MMYKGCIFDLDGTLLNTIDTIKYYGDLALEKYGFDGIDVNRYKYLVGDGAYILVERMLAEKGCFDKEIIDKVHRVYTTAYDSDVLYKTVVYDGIKELISALKEKGYKIAVLSNKPHNATIDVVKLFFGEDTFDFVYGASEEYPIKPDPTLAKVIAEKMGISADECLYVGDTKTDMKTGKGAGFHALGALWGFRDKEELLENGADEIFETPQDIISIL